MPIQELQFNVSSELEKELEFFAGTDEGLKIYSAIRTKEDLVRWVEDNADFVDLKAVSKKVPKGRILDVGVGWGVTSAYLAIHGHEVTGVEPSRVSCDNMLRFFERLGLHVSVIRGTAESMDQLPADFDGVVFWQSLHHCDDPVRALKNSYKVLRPGGWIVLFEPVLRFYRTREWFYRMMAESPQKVGHYGGNEHIYRHHEYLHFLDEAGFKNIVDYPALKYSVDPKRGSWDNAARWLIKRFYYRITRFIAKTPTLAFRLLIRLSLLMPLITAQKPLADLKAGKVSR